MPLDLDSIADVVHMAINDAVAPFKAQLAIAEAKLLEFAETKAALQDLRDRVLVAETKSALLEQRPVPVLETKSDDRWEATANAIAAAKAECSKELAEAIKALDQRPVVDVTPLSDRLAALETKAATLEISASGQALAVGGVVDNTARTVAELAKDFGTLRERVAVVEVRQPMPGPAGKDGAAGKDGVDGLGFDDLQVVQDGRRVTVNAVKGERVKTVGAAVFPSVEYRDVWEAGAIYERGDLTTWGGSMWHCNEATTTKPGESKAWTLMVKRGRDGRDGKDAVVTPVVTVGRS